METLKINISKDVPAEFLSDIMITAFDGTYGASWSWFEPASDDWLVTDKTDGEPLCEIWLSVHVRVQRDEDGEGMTGDRVLDNPKGFRIDHKAIVEGIQRILNDDYVGVWRMATERETEEWLKEGTPRKSRYRLSGVGLKVHTGETAEGYREDLLKIVGGEMDAGDIDAPFADAIIQAAAFGKVIFS